MRSRGRTNIDFNRVVFVRSPLLHFLTVKKRRIARNKIESRETARPPTAFGTAFLVPFFYVDHPMQPAKEKMSGQFIRPLGGPGPGQARPPSCSVSPASSGGRKKKRRCSFERILLPSYASWAFSFLSICPARTRETASSFSYGLYFQWLKPEVKHGSGPGRVDSIRLTQLTILCSVLCPREPVHCSL